ncbi:MAG: hypothetical protein QFF03_16770 [Pseudomonadota bacterium]|nr:hypothetical protein [Pseudomonadota bacterium]
MNTDDMNDAELDAFIKGEDALAGELQAMQQASPSAELDAAILNRAQEMMMREQRPAAANDAANGQPSKPALPRMGLRWRVPAGLAATVMAGVLAHQAWLASSDRTRLPEVSAPAPAAEPAPQQAFETAAPAPAPAPLAPPSARPAQKSAAPVRKPAAAPAPAAPTMAETAPPAAPESPAPLAAPAPALSYSSRYTAPVEAAPTTSMSRSVTVTGHRSRVDAAPATAPDPKVWLATIDELLKAGLQRDTLEEWDKFRAVYPNYPVPADTTEKISALRK